MSATIEKTADSSIQGTLLENFNNLSEWIKGAVEKTGNFIGEQTPIFIQEYLNWIFWDNTLTAVFTFFGLVISLILLICFVRKANWCNYWRNDTIDLNGITSILSLLLTFGFFISFLAGGIPAAKEAIKVKVAPRVVLVDKMAELLKK